MCPENSRQEVEENWRQACNAELAWDEVVQILAQNSSEVRAALETAPDAELGESQRRAFSKPTVFEYLAGKQVGGVHYLHGKIPGIVTGLCG